MARQEQMGFGFEQMEEEKATAHLPSGMEAHRMHAVALNSERHY
jgi:hypothetical protein